MIELESILSGCTDRGVDMFVCVCEWELLPSLFWKGDGDEHIGEPSPGPGWPSLTIWVRVLSSREAFFPPFPFELYQRQASFKTRHCKERRKGHNEHKLKREMRWWFIIIFPECACLVRILYHWLIHDMYCKMMQAKRQFSEWVPDTYAENLLRNCFIVMSSRYENTFFPHTNVSDETSCNVGQNWNAEVPFWF